MKIRLLILTSVFASLFVLGHYYAKPVMAQVRAAIIQNQDEPGRNPYQESYFAFGTDCAAGSQFCNYNFSAVPVGKRLVLTNVSGYVDVKNGTLPNANIQSSVAGSQSAAIFFTGVRGAVSTSGSTRMYFNQPVRAYFGEGEKPHGFEGLVSTTDSFAGGGEMVLSGYYVSLP